MLKRITFLFAATAVLVVPTGAFASETQADGVLPDEACHAVYPAPVQSSLCGRGTGGPGQG